VLLFLVVALSFAITSVALLKVLGRIFVMVLLCHLSDFGRSLIRCTAIWALALPLLFSFVRLTEMEGFPFIRGRARAQIAK
jgi:hypothetical protein